MPGIRLQEYATRIKGLIRDDRLDEAIFHCQHILGLYPKHVQAYRLLGEACLAKRMYQEARECFQRTLSADPESLIAWFGLGKVYAEQSMLPEAVWPMGRAFELAPRDAEVRRELQHLVARRDGAEPARPELTRGALGRLYVRNGLYEQAIGEFHAVLDRDPDLPDVRVALVEALWREGQHQEAVDTCLEILESLPYCLKANLILGEIYVRSGRECAGEARFGVARALDPENLVAQEMMGWKSPLLPEEVLIPELEAKEISPLAAGVAVREQAPVEEIPDWVRELESLEEQEAAAAVAGEDVPAEASSPPEVEALVDDTIFAARMRERLRALVEVGILDEVDLRVGLAEMSAGELGARHHEAIPGWLTELLGEEEMDLVLKEVASLPGVETPIEERLPGVEKASESDEGKPSATAGSAVPSQGQTPE
jgi:tetratricopeptide (TPR) repeat protein